VSEQPSVHPGPAKGLPLDDLDEVVNLRLDLRDALATIGRVRALLGDTAGPLWSVRGVREADLRAALKESGVTS